MMAEYHRTETKLQKELRERMVYLVKDAIRLMLQRLDLIEIHPDLTPDHIIALAKFAELGK